MLLKLIIAIFAIALILKILKSAKVKGKIGEWLVSRALKRRLDPNLYLVLDNLLIPDQNGGTTQIDHLVLSPYGIFVVETKNMKGWIFGETGSAQWMQQIYRCKNQFQNPFRQNYKHLICLSEFTGLPKECFTHVIVFIGDCQIKTPEKLPPALVQSGRAMAAYIKTFSQPVLPWKTLHELHRTISRGRLENTFRNRRAHVRHVKQIIKNKLESGIPSCPLCGAPMVQRQSGQGNDAGRIFWGCPRYPRCRGVRHADAG